MGGSKTKAFLRARLFARNQAYLFLITGARAGLGVLLLAIVRQYRGCAEIGGAISSAFMHGCSAGTQYGAFPALIQRPAFSSTVYCITAFEPHREHLPCSLSVSTRKQSRHSNASDGCSMGLINVPAISTSFRVGDKQLEGFPLVPANTDFCGRGVL